MLINTLLSKTLKTDPDYKNLCKAKTIVTQVARHLNATIESRKNLGADDLFIVYYCSCHYSFHYYVLGFFMQHISACMYVYI